MGVLILRRPKQQARTLKPPTRNAEKCTNQFVIKILIPGQGLNANEKLLIVGGYRDLVFRRNKCVMEKD